MKKTGKSFLVQGADKVKDRFINELNESGGSLYSLRNDMSL